MVKERREDREFRFEEKKKIHEFGFCLFREDKITTLREICWRSHID